MHIYNKHLKIKKIKYFYEFYYKCFEKKEIKTKKKIHDNLYNIINKKKKYRNDLEKKLNEKEEAMYTFSPKINKTLNFNKIVSNKKNYNNIPPIIIIPATSRVYFQRGNGKNINFEEINFTEKNSNILYDYIRKNICDENNKNSKTFKDICLNNKKKLKIDDNYNHFLKSRESNKTFREKNSTNNINNIYDVNSKTNKFSKSKKIYSYNLCDIINNNNNNNSKKIEPAKKIHINKKINEVYFNEFKKKTYNKSTSSNKRRIQSIKQRKRLNTNNETKGFTMSTFSTRDFQNFKTNSKRDSTCDISNYNTTYRTKSIKTRRRLKNRIKEKKENMSLQSLSDSKIMELAGYFLDKKEKDDFLDEVGIKKILILNKNKNSN